MRFPPNLLDDIRARLPISEVVRRRVTFDRRKSQPQRGDYWACCPFHNEKSPSFHADDRKGIYHCFGCSATGDHVKFVMETEGRSFPEAVELLAGLAGGAMPAPDPQSARREARRTSLADVVEAAARFYETAFRGPDGKVARDYAARRRLSAETLAEFRIGFAPEGRDALKRHLAGLRIDEALAVEAGLLIKPDDGRPSYDRFRGRLMIPIHDDRGRVVAFGGRILGEGEPKYLNSPETPLFSKGTLLFNAHRARDAALKAGSIIVTEGYLDAIAVFQAGVRNVVATLGTAFTEEQIVRLWRFAPEPVICFDGDRAGVAAAHRAIDRMLPVLKAGFSFNFCFLPDGKDPDDLVAEGGREAILAAVAAAEPLSEVLWTRETSNANVDTPERRAALEKRIAELTNTIRDPAVQRRYFLQNRLRLSELFWRSDRETRRDGAGFVEAELRLQPQKGEHVGIEEIILGLCVEYPDLYEAHLDAISGIAFSDEQSFRFLRELHMIVFELQDIHPSVLYKMISQEFYRYMDYIHGDKVERTETSSGDVLLIERRAKPYGWRLRGRLPLLNFHPGEDLVERIMLHLVERLLIRTIKKEVEDGSALDALPDAEIERLTQLLTEHRRREEEWQRADQSLAEEAKELRSAVQRMAA